MSDVTVLSKQPPGGRCTLYIRYAVAISRYLDVDSQVKYCEPNGDDAGNPPALPIGETLVEPADGVIVSPQDLIDGLHDRFAEDRLSELQRILDRVQERLMEEWSNE